MNNNFDPNQQQQEQAGEATAEVSNEQATQEQAPESEEKAAEE